MSKLYNYNEAAEYLGISPSTLRKWVCSGKIACTKLGTGPKAPVRFTEEQLKAVLSVYAAI